jgi:N-acyl-D-amino-acid deacylase
MFDLVVRHGTVIDGSSGPRRAADVAVQGGRIVEVGYRVGRGREEIDARGLIVAPGFIDTHTHDDVALLVEPGMAFKVSQGVTTCVCGNCGVSLAPLPEGELPEPLNLFADPRTPRFRRARDYLQALQEQPAAVNSVPLLGHSSLRAMVMDRTDRPARSDEVAAMAALAREALQSGYHGISTGTYYASAAQATTQEVIDVCMPLRELGGVFATHMRDEDDGVIASLDETATIGRALGVMAIVSHHKVAGLANHGRSVQTLARIAELQATQALGLDAYPYVAGSTVLRADRVAGSARTLVTDCASHPEAVGREVGELAQEWGLSIDALCARLAPAAATYFLMSEADVQRILAFPSTMIGSDGIALQKKPHPRLWGTFPRVLGHYCRDHGLFSLEQAVHKMTGLPACHFGLADRGRVAAGMAADLCVFDAATVIDKATFETPEQASHGIEWVIVNGQVAWRDGEVRARAGRLLARPA